MGLPMYVDRIRRAALGALLLLTATIVVPSVLKAQSAPPAPVNLAGLVTGNTVSLSWAPAAGTADPFIYVLEAGTASGAADLGASVIATPGVVAPNIPNGLYYVRVRTANAGGVSGPSNEIVVRVGCVAPPPAPTGLIAQVSGPTVLVGWQNAVGATGYVLEVGSAPGAADLAVVPMGAPASGSPG